MPSQLGMCQRLAARDADHGRAQPAQVVDAPVHLLEGHRLRDLVVLVAVAAAEVAEARRHNLRSTGWPVSSSALATIRSSRTLRVAATQRPRTVDLRGVPSLLLNHTLPIGIQREQGERGWGWKWRSKATFRRSFARKKSVQSEYEDTHFSGKFGQ